MHDVAGDGCLETYARHASRLWRIDVWRHVYSIRASHVTLVMGVFGSIRASHVTPVTGVRASRRWRVCLETCVRACVTRHACDRYVWRHTRVTLHAGDGYVWKHTCVTRHACDGCASVTPLTCVIHHAGDGCVGDRQARSRVMCTRPHTHTPWHTHVRTRTHAYTHAHTHARTQLRILSHAHNHTRWFIIAYTSRLTIRVGHEGCVIVLA